VWAGWFQVEQASSGKLGERKKMLRSVRVVGVTCLSSMNAALQGQTFPVG
jgi:hypothetical protein